MHSVAFLQDLAVVMIVAGLVTIVFHRFKQPVVLGYLLAGVIIGPFTPPITWINDKETISTLADLGVIFLMFSLGLEFNLRKLRQVGATALIAAALEIPLMIWIGYVIGRAFGWSTMDSIFLGAIISISSTTIIVKALGDLGMTKQKFSQLIFGILIIQDLAAVVIIAVLSGIAVTGRPNPTETVFTISTLVVFLVVLLVGGLLLVPRLLSYVGKFRSNEMLLITVLGICFGISLLAVRLDYSVALGAFIAGSIIAEAREAGKIKILTEPIRDMFCAVFFVAIGMLIDPRLLIQYALPIAVITAAVVVGQILCCTTGTFLAGHDTRTSLRVGMGLAQIGEFSFIIASLGLSLKVTSDFLYPIAVCVSAITTLLTPLLIKNSDRFIAWFDRVAPPQMVGSLEGYSGWLEKTRSQREDSMVQKQFRRIAWQITLNITLVAGIFIAAAFVAEWSPKWLLDLASPIGGKNTLLWFCAVLLTLPLYIAIFRKLQALGMMISEVSISPSSSGASTVGARAIVSNVVVLAGVFILSFLSLALSSTILPSWNVLILLLIIIAGITFLFWRHFIRIYSKAQISLQETLNPTREQEPEEHLGPIPTLLKTAMLETVAIVPGSRATGKLIRELELRSQTGASVVAIDRAGLNLINPGPDDDIQAGDQVVLLGGPDQLEKARKLLAQPA